MQRTAAEYYEELSRRYDQRIRQLVPRYDEMLATIIGLLRLTPPRSILEVGAGTGAVCHVLLDAFPDARITALEPSMAMVAEARRDLGTRVRIVNTDVLAFVSDTCFDAVVSNLALHNLPHAEKLEALRRIRGWLVPRGPFVWGDLIRHPDPAVQDHAVAHRRAFALAAGCEPELVAWNFQKEGGEDAPLTLEETLAAASGAGFAARDVVWVHGTFAIVHLRPQR